MLKQHSQLAVCMLVVADACAVTVAWLISFYLRFYGNVIPVDPSKGVPDLWSGYLTVLPAVVAAHLFIFHRMRLYRPRRDGAILGELRDVVRAFIAAVVTVVLIDYAMPATHKISRGFVLTYAIVGTGFFASLRFAARLMLRSLRRRGLNRRSAAIIGSGRAAQRLLHALRRNTWTGYDVRYFVDDKLGNPVRGVEVRGPLGRLREILNEAPVDCIFLALPGDQAHRTNELLSALEHSTADVRLVPEIDPAFAMRPNIADLDGVAILSLRQTPLVGWNAIFKRAFDIVVGGICLIVALPLLAVIALAIRLTSRGPILYRQRRLGLDGQEFTIVKFRTMRVDAEASGPQWSQRGDPRRTAIGAFLRRTSLDELPNLFNVLRGEMSLVGPRPERPEFIEQFKHEIPRYMLRHKMKAGMTGYAQVRGWRGDTSLRKRIQHDVHYIKNWSLLMDVRILAATLTHVWFSRHEERPGAPASR